jgi:hypothetical protein
MMRRVSVGITLALGWMLAVWLGTLVTLYRHLKDMEAARQGASFADAYHSVVMEPAWWFVVLLLPAVLLLVWALKRRR